MRYIVVVFFIIFTSARLRSQLLLWRWNDDPSARPSSPYCLRISLCCLSGSMTWPSPAQLYRYVVPQSTRSSVRLARYSTPGVRLLMQFAGEILAIVY